MNEIVAKRVASVGLALQLALLVGLGVTVVGALGTFAGIGGAKDRAEAAASIIGGVSQALRATMFSVPVAFAGLILLALALRDGRGRESWIFVASCVALCFWLLVFPVGTVIGVIGLCLLIPRRREFMKKGDPVGTDNDRAAPRRV